MKKFIGCILLVLSVAAIATRRLPAARRVPSLEASQGMSQESMGWRGRPLDVPLGTMRRARRQRQQVRLLVRAQPLQSDGYIRNVPGRVGKTSRAVD